MIPDQIGLFEVVLIPTPNSLDRKCASPQQHRGNIPAG